MADPLIIKGKFVEGSDIKIMARIVTYNGTVLAPGDMDASTVQFNAYDMASPGTAIKTNTSILQSAVIGALATTAVGWQEDSIGCNFQFIICNTTVPGSVTNGVATFTPTGAIGGHKYRFEWELSSAVYGKISVIAELGCISRLSV